MFHFTLDDAVLDLMTGATSGAVDNKRNALTLRAVRGTDMEDVALRMILAKRAEHRAWTFQVQRSWQGKTRRPSRARHHDSVSIREKYVRCHG